MFRSLLAVLAISTFAGCAVTSEPTTDEGAASADEAAARRICPMVYDPVCGVNGKTYSNACVAGKVKIAHKGECAPSCESTVCAAGEHCELQQVQCITTPCYPQPVCIPDIDACATVRCAAGTTCQVQKDGGASCVPDAPTGCAAILCGPGTTCQVQPDGSGACVGLPKDFCNTTADCSLKENYCWGECGCLALSTNVAAPTCENPVNCLISGCSGKTVSCVNNQCVMN